MTKEYIEYNTNIEDSFFRYIDKPQTFVTEEKYIGRLNRNNFWFYRKHPMINNSFRTVLYAEIIDDNLICYHYGKIKGVKPLVIIIDSVFLIIFAVTMITYLFLGDMTPPFQIWFFIIIPAVITVLTFICPKKEKDLLYAQLLKICKNSTM